MTILEHFAIFTSLKGRKRMKPCDNQKFNEMWQNMMRQLDNVLSAAYTEDGFDKLSDELENFKDMEDDFEREVLFK